MIFIRALSVFTLFSIVASTQGYAETITACVKKNGQIRIAAKCKKNEKLISWNAEGIQGTPGLQGLPGVQGSVGEPGVARAYGEVAINTTTGDFELVPGTTKNVVALDQGGGGNPAACISLDPSIDATKAIVMATPNLRTGSTTAFNTQVMISRSLGYCGGIGTNVVEIVTTTTDSPGGAVKRAFHFLVN